MDISGFALKPFICLLVFFLYGLHWFWKFGEVLAFEKLEFFALEKV